MENAEEISSNAEDIVSLQVWYKWILGISNAIISECVILGCRYFTDWGHQWQYAWTF